MASSSKKTFFISLILILFALAGGFLAGTVFHKKVFDHTYLLNEYNKVDVILDIINREYVDSVSIQDLTESAIPKIMNELDPHSSYISALELQSIKEDLEGHFAGLGVDYAINLDTIVVISVSQGGPSQQAGILPGDRIVRVNNELFIGPDINDEKIASTFRGEVGTPVTLSIRRNHAPELIDYTIIRDEIPLTTIKAAYEIAPQIGFIKIYDKFSQSTYDEFIAAVAKLLHQGCTSFILDLRSNKGGALNAALAISNEFLQGGQKILYTEGQSFPREDIRADGTGTLQDHQLVILIDEISASASEVIAGAIQDNDRGLIIGRKSFGKGLVQNQIELSDGSAIRLTSARYFTPSGRNIQRPYQMGAAEKYNQEWIDNLYKGEGMSKNIIDLDSTKLFLTRNGRPVFGNGGIMPDIFVPIDTTGQTSYFLNLERKGILHHFAFEYSDANRDTLSQFSNYQEMLEYLQAQPMLYQVVKFADKKGIRQRTSLIQISREKILNNTYANILQNFFGEEAFFTVYLQNDPAINRAIEAIEYNYAQPSAIALMDYKDLE